MKDTNSVASVPWPSASFPSSARVGVPVARARLWCWQSVLVVRGPDPRVLGGAVALDRSTHEWDKFPD